MSLRRLLQAGGTWAPLEFVSSSDPRGDRDAGAWQPVAGEPFSAWYAPTTSTEDVNARDTSTLETTVNLGPEAADVVVAESRGRDGHGREWAVDGHPYIAITPGKGVTLVQARIRAIV